jgi:hypothetical protein
VLPRRSAGRPETDFPSFSRDIIFLARHHAEPARPGRRRDGTGKTVTLQTLAENFSRGVLGSIVGGASASVGIDDRAAPS